MRVRRFRLVGLMVVVLIAAMALGAARTFLPEPQAVQPYRQAERENRRMARMWHGYLRLALSGITEFQSGRSPDGRPDEMLLFNHFVPQPRPTDPVAALAFDRRRREVERKSRAMRDHYQRLADKWADAADRRLATVPPDPDPPYNVEFGVGDSSD